jgi:hypothetical protein
MEVEGGAERVVEGGAICKLMALEWKVICLTEGASLRARKKLPI